MHECLRQVEKCSFSNLLHITFLIIFLLLCSKVKFYVIVHTSELVLTTTFHLFKLFFNYSEIWYHVQYYKHSLMLFIKEIEFQRKVFFFSWNLKFHFKNFFPWTLSRQVTTTPTIYCISYCFLLLCVLWCIKRWVESI